MTNPSTSGVTYDEEGTRRQRRRVDYVTRNFASLKGLYALPFGLLLMLLAALRLGLWTLPGSGDWGPAALTAALFLSLAATKLYYDRRFGRITPQPSDAANYALLAAFRAVAVTLFFLPLAARTGGWPWLAFPLVALALSVGVRRGDLRFRTHWLAVALLAACLSPLLTTEQTLSLAVRLGSLGAYLAIGGLLDHCLLVRTLRPLPNEANGEAI